MVDPPVPPLSESLADQARDPADDRELARLRELLVGRERRRLRALEERLDELAEPDELARQLPEAIANSVQTDDRLARALAPSIDDAMQRSVRSNPQRIADAIYPTLGPAIRKAIAQTMAGLVESINKAIEHSLSIQGLKWRFEAWRTGVPYPQVVIKHALVYRIEQVLLIHGETGLLLAHAKAPDLEADDDADVISGMLTAIRDFARDSFQASTDGDLDVFTIGDLTVYAQRGPHAVVAGVVRGQAPPEVREHLQEVLELVHLQFGTALRDFDGDASAFDKAQNLLETALHTEVAVGRAAGRHAPTRLAWGVAAAVLFLVALWIFNSSGRWRQARRALENEPGLIVLGAERSWGTWRFRGLRDPDARDPMLVLADLGVDTTDVAGQWETYLSFDPTMVVRRALRQLEAPTSVAVRVSGDTVVATGSARAEWVPVAIHEIEALPLVAHFDASALDVEFPPELAEPREIIESQRLRFVSGSAEISGVGVAALRVIAEQWPAVDSVAGGIGYNVTMEVVGRSDMTGTAELNERLSDDRAAATTRVLVALGIPERALTPIGIGTRDPLVGSTPQETAQMNRSVSFVVRLIPQRAWEGEAR